MHFFEFINHQFLKTENQNKMFCASPTENEKFKNLKFLEFFIFSKILGSIFDGDIFIEDFINPEKFNPVTKTW